MASRRRRPLAIRRKNEGYTQESLARALVVDCTTVQRWENGTRSPQPWIRPKLANLLKLSTRDLDQLLDSHEPGIEVVPDVQPTDAVNLSGELTSAFNGDTADSVVELGRMDVERRRFVAAAAAVSLAALGMTDIDAIIRRVRRAHGRKVGAGEVSAIHAMTQALGDTAAEFGGGHARNLAVYYLTETVRPWLDGTFTENTGRELYAAASQLVHLIGWMARDAGEQGLAQHYQVHSYKLAAEAGAHELAATALRGLADQAIDLGFIPTAVSLAEACERHGRSLDNPKALAYYRNIHARAAAADADRRAAVKLLGTAQTAIENAPASPGQSWASHYSHGRWAHESGMILASLGDWTAAEEHLRLALDIHGLDRKRTRAIVLADLGTIQLKQGNTDQALDTWRTFLDTSEGVQSVRINDGIDNISARVLSIPTTTAALELRERLAARQTRA